MVSMFRCIDKSRIIGSYDSLTAETMTKVDKALAIATGLMKNLNTEDFSPNSNFPSPSEFIPYFCSFTIDSFLVY
jgi:hypothetical protein